MDHGCLVALDPLPTVQGGGIHIDLLGVLLSLVNLILTIVIVYYLFEGVRDMATRQQQVELAEEAVRKWRFYLTFQLVALANSFLIFFPPIFILMMIALAVTAIALMIVLMRFMLRYGEQLGEPV